MENVLLDENDQIVLIDPGLSLRVPYTDPSNFGCITDASAGTYRRLIKAQGQGGKLMYAAPEVIERDDVFDGFAVDLWSAGVILFVMLVGLAPFQWAHPSDKRYAKISKGGLGEMMTSLNIPISADACDLLQCMLWRDPMRRFTLAEVMDHPWTQGAEKHSEDRDIQPDATPKASTYDHQQENHPLSNAQLTCHTQNIRRDSNMRPAHALESSF
jgi:serine/threonine protein kinase